MSIIQNLMNTPYKRATEEFINKDTSITASYGRTHVIPSGSGLMGIVLLVAVVGYIFAMVTNGSLVITTVVTRVKIMDHVGVTDNNSS